MPSPRGNNRYAILSVDEPYECNDVFSSPSDPDSDKAVPPPSFPTTPHLRIPKWERRLPTRYVISATPSANSLELKVGFQTTDTGTVHGVTALVDSGATDLFIDADYVREQKLTTRALSRPIAVYNVDGTPNEAGSIRAIVDVVLRYKDHAERAQFAITRLGGQKMILGHSWLREHNPEVDWKTGEVKMTRCPQ